MGRVPVLVALACVGHTALGSQPVSMSVDYEEIPELHLSSASCGFKHARFSGDSHALAVTSNPCEPSFVQIFNKDMKKITVTSSATVLDVIVNRDASVIVHRQDNSTSVSLLYRAAGSNVTGTIPTGALNLTPSLSRSAIAHSDNRMAICAGKSIGIFDITTSAAVTGSIRELTGLTSDCKAVGISPEGDYVAAGGRQLVWYSATGEKRFEAREAGTITAVTCSSRQCQLVGVNAEGPSPTQGRGSAWVVENNKPVQQGPYATNPGMTVPVGAGEAGLYGHKEWLLVAHAWNGAVNVSSVGSYGAVETEGDWSKVGEPSHDIEMSQLATRLAIVHSKSITVYGSCIADMTKKKFNIPHNGYDPNPPVTETTHQACHEACCKDSDKCTMFQWLGDLSVLDGTSYPKKHCLLFSDSESELVDNQAQPFHTFIIRKLELAPPKEEDSVGMIVRGLIVVAVLCLVGLVIFCILRRIKSQRSAPKEPKEPKEESSSGVPGGAPPDKNGKHNVQPEINAGLLENIVTHSGEGDAAEMSPIAASAPKKKAEKRRDSRVSNPPTPSGQSGDTKSPVKVRAAKKRRSVTPSGDAADAAAAAALKAKATDSNPDAAKSEDTKSEEAKPEANKSEDKPEEEVKSPAKKKKTKKAAEPAPKTDSEPEDADL